MMRLLPRKRKNLILVTLIILFIAAVLGATVCGWWCPFYPREIRIETFQNLTASNISPHVTIPSMLVQTTKWKHYPLTLGISSQHPLYLQIIKALNQIFPIEIHVYPSNKIGLRAMQEGPLDIFLGPEHIMIEHLQDTSPISDTYHHFPPLGFVCALFPESFTLMTHLQGPIQSWKDLRHHKVAVVNEQDHRILTNLLQMISLKDDVDIIEIKKHNEIITWFQASPIQTKVRESGRESSQEKYVDAIFMLSGHPSSFITRLCQEVKVLFITTQSFPLSEIQFAYPSSFHSYIDTRYYKVYPPNKPMIPSHSLRCCLFSTHTTPTDWIYHLVKAIFENIEYLKYKRPFLEFLSPERISFVSRTLSYHEGAKKYYTDIGYISDKADGCIHVGVGY